MRRTLRYVALWLGATAVAVSVSWLGVRDVLRQEFVDDVAVRPAATAPAAARTVADRNEATMTQASPVPRRAAKKTPGPAPTADVEVLTVKGGEVAFTIGAKGCRLESATPKSGYTAKVNGTDGWIRVDLVQGAHGSSVFCISHERRTDTWEF
ncbi:hypothetical protein [Nonomuraea longicatena]|uniref:Secreted protein n=1 Tax=Nonomuraea longicatena TaxID=83682 RepID=A0ABN1NKS7_9ACTN